MREDEAEVVDGEAVEAEVAEDAEGDRTTWCLLKPRQQTVKELMPMLDVDLTKALYHGGNLRVEVAQKSVRHNVERIKLFFIASLQIFN